MGRLEDLAKALEPWPLGTEVLVTKADLTHLLERATELEAENERLRQALDHLETELSENVLSWATNYGQQVYVQQLAEVARRGKDVE